MRGWRTRLRGALDRPVDPAGLAAFRVLFGGLLFVAMVRFLASGWIPTFFAAPRFHFRYAGLGWVEVLPLPAMYAMVAALALLALLLALGWRTRAVALLFVVGFTYLEAIDVTNYLNHYYLVALLALLCAALPVARVGSLDARRRPPAVATVPAWVVGLFRLQIAVVYGYAGLAKLNGDWLLHAQPLSIWLTARADTPLIGPWLGEPAVHVAASWFGFLFDTTIVGWLAWRRTRVPAYVVLLGFHGLTHAFFNIGLFPFVMSIAATLFFAPDWPRRLLGRRAAPATDAASSPHPTRRAALALAAAYAVVQLALPLRHLLYPGDVAWNEEGMRWSWKVMLREKHGSVTYRVRLPARGVELEVSPRRYLDGRQEREMAGQPDLILQLAHHIRDELAAAGEVAPEVRVDALVSLNGRPPRPMIDPGRDLARVEDGLAPAAWILPAPDEPPPRVGR